MTDKLPANPLRDGLASRAMPEPCSVVIFGATGDLTHRKLIPALYNLAADGDLPPGLSVVGFARRDKTDEIFEPSSRKRQGSFPGRLSMTICGKFSPAPSTITEVNSATSRGIAGSGNDWTKSIRIVERAGTGSTICGRA